MGMSYTASGYNLSYDSKGTISADTRRLQAGCFRSRAILCKNLSNDGLIEPNLEELHWNVKQEVSLMLSCDSFEHLLC